MSKWVKVVSSGHIIEVYTYQYMPPPGKRQTDDLDDDLLREEHVSSDEKQKENDRVSKWNFIRVINSNFNAMDKFVTLTFAENVTDLDEAHKQFKQFIQRMRYRYGDFKYGVAIEFQKRGAVHYHMVSDLTYVPNKELKQIWRQGFVRINAIKHVDNVGAYLSKYMTKESEGRDNRLRGRKMSLTSHNLERPLIFKGDEAEAIINLYNLKQKKEVLASSYTSEHHGEITYSQYNLKRSLPHENASDKVDSYG